MPKPNATDYRQPRVSSFTGFDTVSSVKQALTSLENGIFGRAAQLVDVMTRDDRINGVVSTRIDALKGLQVEWEPGRGARADEVAEDIEDRWLFMWPEAEAGQLLFWGRMIGIGIGQNVWHRSASEWRPRLRVWHPQFLTYRWETQSYWLRTADAKEVEVVPGDGTWVVYAPYGLERPWMGALVRSLAVPWLIRQWAQRDRARWSELHGKGVWKGSVPMSDADDQEKIDAFYEDIADLGREPIIILPRNGDGEGYNLELLEANSRSWEGFASLISDMNTSIAIDVLGQNLSTEVKSGSYAAASVHERVRQDKLESDAETLSTCAHDHTLAPWALYNYGDPNLAPWPRWKTEPPEDRKLKADMLLTLSQSVVPLSAAGVDIRTVLQSMGLPLLDEPKPITLPLPQAPIQASVKSFAAAPKNPLVETILESLRPEPMLNAVLPVMRSRMEAWAKKRLGELGVPGRFDVLSPLIPHRVEAIGAERIAGDVHDVTREALRQTLADGVRAGEDARALARRVRDVFDEADQVRAVRIARTEVVGASNWATYEAQKISGVVRRRRWVATRDGRAREEHLALDGVEVGIDEPFRIGGLSAMYPGGFGVPEQDIQCRCTTVPVIADTFSAADTEALAAAWRRFDRAIVPWEREVTDALRAGFREQLDAVLRAIGIDTDSEDYP